MDQTVVLADIEWTQLMAIIANAQGAGITWGVVNPLLMKLGAQLQAQVQGQAQQAQTPIVPGDGLDRSVGQLGDRSPLSRQQ